MKNTIEDFWRRVDKISNPNGCWEWIAGLDKSGYGYFWFEGKIRKSHRFSAELAGMIPGELFVCHKCDNPKCVNPSHLFLGTNTDNMRDMFSKGRRPDVRKLGEAHGMARLTEKDVLFLRDNCPHTVTAYKKYAQQYNVHHDTIKCAVTRKTWRHI